MGQEGETPTPPEAEAAAAEVLPGGAESAARIAELERQLAEEREHATDYMHRWQRAQADFANYKRRTQQEQEQRDALLVFRALSATLPALDSLERAFSTLPPTLRGYSWIDGIALVRLELENALRTQGIQPFDTQPGQAFDPMRHESIGEVETAEQSAGSIAVVLQRGYEAAGLTLRPALVQVAKAPTQAPAAEAAETAETAETAEAAPDEGAGETS